jgi:hypothetical protein
MKYLILSMFLVSCVEERTVWKIMTCPTGQNTCFVSDVYFDDLKSCEDVAKFARTAQPDTARICFSKVIR